MDLGSAPLVLEFWPRKNSEPRLRYKQKSILESQRGRTSEPAELHGLREQITEANEAPLELRKERSEENTWGRR